MCVETLPLKRPIDRKKRCRKYTKQMQKKNYKWNKKKFAIAAILVEKERKKNDAMDGFLFT